MKTIIAAWLMTAIQANGGIASFKITETEQICREIVCAAQFGESCASKKAADQAEAKHEDEMRMAWKVENPKRAAYCNAHFAGTYSNGFTWNSVGADEKPCGPLIAVMSVSRAYGPTDVMTYRCTEAKSE